jgi:small-conductance mechanosensitive channel
MRGCARSRIVIEDDRTTITSDDKERFVRWQRIHIDHLSYSTSLILVLGIATVSYSLSLTGSAGFAATKAHHCYVGVLLLIAVVIFALSVLCGLLCTLNRLRDFRWTAQRAKGSAEEPTKEELRRIGRRTHLLFESQVWLFIGGLLLLAIVIGHVYGPRLI